jgi:hypothetical protein
VHDLAGLPAAEPRGPAPQAGDLPAAAPAIPVAAPRDAPVEGALLRSAAHLRLETPTLGELELHLRIRENTAHLRVEGDGAHLVEARAGELQRALAGEGLRLGSLDLPGPSTGSEPPSGGPPEHQLAGRGGARNGDEPQQPAPAPAPTPRRPAPRTSGGVHVKA